MNSNSIVKKNNWPLRYSLDQFIRNITYHYHLSFENSINRTIFTRLVLSIASVKSRFDLLIFPVCFFSSLPGLNSYYYLKQKSMNIYISNLSFNIHDKELSSFFTGYGEV